MHDLIIILKEFEGIMGTILGSVTTLIVTDLLRKIGKLKLYLIEWRGVYYSNSELGEIVLAKDDKNLYNFGFSYILQVYNKSDTPKIMRNFKVKFYKNKEVFSLIPYDDSTRSYQNHILHIENIEVINVKPKEIQVLKQSGYINFNELPNIENSSKVELTYYDEKDRKRKVVLFKGIISKDNIKS